MIYPQIPTSITTLRAKVDIYNGDTLAATCSCSDFLQDFTIHKEGDSSKFFGFGVSHKLDINFIDIEKKLKTKIEKGSKLVIKMGDGTTFYDVYPPMYVAEVTRNEKTNNISCVAYDVLYKTKTLTVTDLFNYIAEGHESYPDPLWISHIIQACGRLLTDGQLGSQLTSTSSIQNFSYVVNNQFNLNGNEPLKILLDAIAEFTQTIYYMDHLGRLTYKTLNYHDSPVLTVDKDKYFDLVTSEPKAISGLCLTNELGDSITAGDESGEVQIIRSNPIYEAEPDRAAYLEKAMAVVLGSYGQYNTVFTPLVYHQLECEWDGDCNLSPGDKVAFVTEDDSIITTYLINDVIEYRGFLNEITSWEYTKDEEETADNPTTLGDKLKQTTAIVDKVNQEINLVVQDVAGINSEIAQIKLTTNDINLRVEKIENLDFDLNIADDEDFKALTERVGQLEITDENITASVSTLEGEMTTIKQNLSELAITDAEIRATVSAVEQTIANSSDSVNKEIETLTKEVNLKVSSEDVTIAISKSLSEGVDKVVTSTKKYTFDDTGLNIGDSNSEITTVVSEDGMKIYKQNTEVLVADNQGVKAEDLHATTYLIIGDNSRLEDWQNNYTACFWIGGNE